MYSPIFFLLIILFYYSYSENTSKPDAVVKKLVTGDDPPVNKVYKPEFVTLAPPLMNCQDEVSYKILGFRVQTFFWLFT